jgi:hypothetical protein
MKYMFFKCYIILKLCDFKVTEIQSGTIFVTDALGSSVVPEIKSPNITSKTSDLYFNTELITESSFHICLTFASTDENHSASGSFQQALVLKTSIYKPTLFVTATGV